MGGRARGGGAGATGTIRLDVADSFRRRRDDAGVGRHSAMNSRALCVVAQSRFTTQSRRIKVHSEPGFWSLVSPRQVAQRKYIWTRFLVVLGQNGKGPRITRPFARDVRRSNMH